MSISDKTLNRMTQCAFMAQHQSQTLLNSNDALNSALELMNACDLNQDQKDKIEGILKSPCSDNAQEATDKMKEHICIVLKGGVVPTEQTALVTTTCQLPIGNTHTTGFNYLEGLFKLCSDVVQPILSYCWSGENGWKTIRNMVCINKQFYKLGTGVWDKEFAHVKNSEEKEITYTKMGALVQLLRIKANCSVNPCDHFIINPSVCSSDLEILIENMSEDEDPSCLCDHLDSAYGIDNFYNVSVKDQFRLAIKQFQGEVTGCKQMALKSLLCKFSCYFDMIIKSEGINSHTAHKLRHEYPEIVEIINKNKSNCIDDTLAKVQETMLGIAAHILDSSCSKEIAKIKIKVNHVLNTYRNCLLRYIICKQLDPNEEHLDVLENLIKQKMSPIFSCNNTIFTIDSQVQIDNLEGKIKLVEEAFLAEYNPIEYLVNEICSAQGSINLLRNNLIEWIDEQYSILDEDPEVPQLTDMNPILSANFEPDSINQNFDYGGVWSLAAALFILEEAGIIQRK